MAVPNTLQDIRTKVRRLTRSLSPNQISDADIDLYINTFILYDFPAELKLFSFKKEFEWICDPYIDTYETDTSIDPSNQLYDFKNIYSGIDQPIYIAGQPAFFSLDRQQFYGLYPITNSIINIGTGDGVTTAFNGTINQIPILQNEVLISAISTTNERLSLFDDPQSPSLGNLVEDDLTIRGNINYITGAYTFDFVTAAPKDGTQVQIQCIPYVPSLPTAVLWFENKFILRPVPDRPYNIQLNVFARPTELLQANEVPELEQWWQYIAYGAAKKILEDRLDFETVNIIMPEFKNQERLILRRTLIQQTPERTATIYTEQTSLGGWNNFNDFGGS